jgi:hypothetical protein
MDLLCNEPVMVSALHVCSGAVREWHASLRVFDCLLASMAAWLQGSVEASGHHDTRQLPAETRCVRNEQPRDGI